MSKKILICGHFANNQLSYDGQTIKTVNIYKELLKKYDKENILIADTFFIKNKPLSFFLDIIKNVKSVDNVIILPAQRGVKILIPFFNYLNKKKKFNIHYIVIGAWLPSIIEKSNYLIKQLKKIDYIYIETVNTIKKMEKLGFTNVVQMNNFKQLNVSVYKYHKKKNFHFCIFSRIEYLKGINDAIFAINKINEKEDNKVFLDIFGKIKEEYKEEFFESINNNKYIEYKGIIDSNKSVEALEKYDALLFPTLFYTEGIPGTIIDAYFAGVPVISSRWENYSEVIDDGITGLTYEFAKKEELAYLLFRIINGEYNLEKMRDNCKKHALKYLPDNSLKILFDNLKK